MHIKSTNNKRNEFRQENMFFKIGRGRTVMGKYFLNMGKIRKIVLIIGKNSIVIIRCDRSVRYILPCLFLINIHMLNSKY